MPFTAHVPAGAALFGQPCHHSSQSQRYRQTCGKREPQRHQALRMAEQGLMAPLPLILQPCSESYHLDIEASLPDLLHIQVAGNPAVEELAAAQSAVKLCKLDALESNLNSCRHLSSAEQMTAPISVLDAQQSHHPTFVLKCTTQLPQGTGEDLRGDARALTAACQEMMLAGARLREGLASRTLSAWTLGQGRAGYGALQQPGSQAKVLYAVMSDKDSMASLATASSDQAALHDDGAKSHPIPHVGPVSIGKVAAPSWETRTALLHFHGMSKEKGGLSGLPGLPTWTVLANASRVLHLGFGGARSILSVNQHTLQQRAPLAATSALVLTVQRTGPQQYVFAASDAGTGRCCLEGTFHADFLYAAPQAAAAPAGARYFRAAPRHLAKAGSVLGHDVAGDAFGEGLVVNAQAFGKEAALDVQASNVVSGGSLISRLDRHVGDEAAALMLLRHMMVPL